MCMEIEIKDLQAQPIPRELICRVARAAGRRVSPSPVQLSIAFVDDARITEINRRFRGKDRATDVIAFEPAGDAEAAEIIVSVETAQRQARQGGHSCEVELAWLVCHGVLHCAGMEDDTAEQLEQMLAVQRDVMREIGCNIPA